ncbi:MAG: class I SAM-dependent methyltransferase [Nitrospira sp.]|nr:class I SAM-dependent methyltransferase [Nitrospira sp.]
MSTPAIEDRMREYYAQRAAIYERVYHKPERQADLRAMQAWLAGLFVGRRVLEVACGTGWWTPHGARAATSWLATDVNPETIAIAQAKAMPPTVRFGVVDAYRFAELGTQRFDGAFAGFWWSHVLRARLPAWLALLHERLDPGARVALLDNRYVEGNSTPLSRRDADGNTYQLRTLDDGSTHEVVKNFPTRDEALAALGPRARDVQWIEHAHYWTLSYTLR